MLLYGAPRDKTLWYGVEFQRSHGSHDAYAIRKGVQGRLAAQLKNRNTLRDLIVFNEVLNRPVGLR